MGSRRKSRELALQALFYMDIRKDISEEALDHFCRNFEPAKKMKPFFIELVNGVSRNLAEIDHLIEKFSKMHSNFAGRYH